MKYNWNEAVVRGIASGGDIVAGALDSITGATLAGYHTQHTVDDAHSTIKATGSISERGRGVPLGETINVFLKPSLFSGNGTMTWTPTLTGNNTALRYTLMGMWMLLDVRISASVIGGALNNALQITVPDGYYVAANSSNAITVVDNAVRMMGTIVAGAGTNIVSIFRIDLANWVATPVVVGQIMFEIRTA